MNLSFHKFQILLISSFMDNQQLHLNYVDKKTLVSKTVYPGEALAVAHKFLSVIQRKSWAASSKGAKLQDWAIRWTGLLSSINICYL